VTTSTEALTGQAGRVEPVWIEVIAGPSQGARAKLESGTLFVGKDTSCDLVLSDGAVSRRHASFELLDGHVRVRDLNSRNGTSYLGARVTEAVVPVGATVSLGRSTLAVRWASEQALAPAARDRLGGLVGKSESMRRVFAQLEKLAASDVTALFTGESGTGKEAAARTLHGLSARATLPFVVVDCASMSEQLFEAQLFGHKRGAFTGAERDHDGLVAQARGGTLFLDEVGALAPAMQPKLLRLLESREYQPVGGTAVEKLSARVMASTQRALDDKKTFREDLYYRLAVSVVELPPLRERPGDVPLLARHFAGDVKLSSQTLEALQQASWPGNARELRNAVERAFALGDFRETQPKASAGSESFLEARERVVSAFERDFLTSLLEQHEGHVSNAAKAAGLARSAFYRLLDKHGLTGRSG
jgi:DNA-binding NtrC family response regulator